MYYLIKVLIWEDAAGNAWISYNTPAYLQARHHLDEDLVQRQIGSGIAALAAKAAD